jgi:hypothetical protein
MRYFQSEILFFILLFIACTHSTKNPNGNIKPNNIRSHKNDTIQIVCLDFKEKYLLPIIKSKIESYYHCPTVVNELRMPESVISPLRHRYEGIKIIDYLKNQNKRLYKFYMQN